MKLRKIAKEDISGIDIGNINHSTLGMVSVTVSPSKKAVYLYVDGKFHCCDIDTLLDLIVEQKEEIDKE